MEERKSNLPAEKKVEKVVSGTVKTKKKNELSKITDVFISEDVRNVKNYILMDVLVPAVKDAIEDIITNGIRMILRGETGARKSNSTASKVSYRSYYDDRHSNERRYNDRPTSRYSYDDLIFDSRGDAEEVLDRMCELISKYQMATVADLFEFAGETDRPYTDNKYGWTNLRNAEVIRVRGGYMIKMPKALPMD